MFPGKYQAALVAAIVASALWGSASRLAADEMRLRLHGNWSDGTRHLDKLYLREPDASPRFWTVSTRPQRLPESVSAGGTAASDEQGRGSWYQATPVACGDWQCLEAEFAWYQATPVACGDWQCLEAEFDSGVHLTLWINESNGNVLYYGHHAASNTAVAGRGDCR